MITVLWTSANNDGLTAEATKRIVSGIEAAGEARTSFYLNELHLHHCMACNGGWGLCKSEGRCIIEDDFEKVYDAVLASDAVVFVTAVYWHDLTECFKAFFDRFRRCETAHNKQMRGRECLLVACAGGTGNGAIRCLENLEHSVDHMGMVPVDRLPVIQFNKAYMLPALEEAGKAFAERVSASR